MGTDDEQAKKTRRVVIIGGVAAGMSAATRLRRLDETASIVVLERNGYVSFANCGLAYWLGGVIDDRDALLLQSPERLEARFRLDVRVHHEVTDIDLGAREVVVRDTNLGDDLRLHFDDLIIATGARAVDLHIPGGERALALRSVEDMDLIGERLDGLSPGVPVAVIGGGYVGLELAENLDARGFKVTLIQRSGHLLPNVDIEMASILESRLRDKGVRLILGAKVTSIDENSVHVEGELDVAATLVVAGVGVVPESGVAQRAGIRVGDSGGIVVNARGETSASRVFAVGDVAEKPGFLGAPVLVALAGPANRDGRYLADTIVGTPRTARPILGTSIVEAMGLAVGSAGITESVAVDQARAIRVIHTHPSSHTTYYPGSRSMALKLIIDADTDLILGVQGVGEAGVDKRIDVIATAMTAGLTASDLADLELAYAPQFGAAKDPVNMLGYIASNMAAGNAPTVQWHELEDLMAREATVVDVRTEEEFAQGAIPGAVNIPLDELRSRASELRSRTVIVHCQVGQRGHAAASLLRQLGYTASNLDGGYRTWKDGTDAQALAAQPENKESN